MFDEYFKKNSFVLESTKKKDITCFVPSVLGLKTPPKNNEFLNKVHLFDEGPLIYGQTEYSENVIWTGSHLWLLHTQISEVIQQRLLSDAETGSVFKHPFFNGEIKIKDLKCAGESVQVIVDLNV